ncbi:unnamed protein product [Paramecium sonneborni]|uniref:E2F/DP family winged-helix DNA-binding domain-containing protein n=1 Tax=Paramecium sonneborni TaxID=65129 RepID=A0A8S1MDD9_9CILI|nr:unnamed protein product [Paramecium sonneborni]
MTDQTPNDFHSEMESSPLNHRQSNMILFQPYSPILFRAHCSPNNMVLQDYYIAQPIQNTDDIFPFDQQALSKMFDNHTSNNQSPQLKQVVIKQSQNKQQGFQIVQINTTQMTPQKRRSEQTRRYYSEKNEKKSINLAFYQDQTPQRSQKGLRNLSVKVRDIVLELKSTSYKDVAQRLIQDLGSDGQIVELDNPKDEQNIKRRVYDALNVMIASKVLRKEGKRVLSDIYCKHRMRRNETDMFKEQLVSQKIVIKDKQKRLQELFIKVVALKNLVQRNQNNQSENKMMFPILAFQAQQSQIKLKMESKVLKIMSQQKLRLSADLDILVQLKMYKLYKNMEEFMPKNLLDIVQINDLCS